MLGSWTQHDPDLAEMFILLHRGAARWAAATYPADDEAARAAVAREMTSAIAEIPYPPDERLVRLFGGRVAWTTRARPVATTAPANRKKGAS